MTGHDLLFAADLVDHTAGKVVSNRVAGMKESWRRYRTPAHQHRALVTEPKLHKKPIK